MLMLILTILIWGFLLFTLLRYVAFLLSNGLAGQLSEIGRGVGNLPLAVCRSVALAIAGDALVVIGCLSLLWQEREEGDGTTPVLMVHGLYHNRTAWLFFARRLRRAGFTNLHTYGYNSFTRDFDHAMEGMTAKLDALLGDDPDARVILVGHSLGGLLCRCAAGDPRYRRRVSGLVTLGSPHKGSELAFVGANRMARGLIPGQGISQAVEAASDPDCQRLGIYTLIDDYVFPLDMLRTGRTGWEERVCSPMSHVWMLYSEEVAGMVVEFLGDEPS